MPEGVVDDDKLPEVFLQHPTLFQFGKGWGMWDGELVPEHRHCMLKTVEYEGKSVLLSDPRPGVRVFNARIAEAMEYLASQPENYIVIVAHSAFLHRLMQCL